MLENDKRFILINTITNIVIEMIKNGHSRDEVSKILKTLDISEHQARDLLDRIVEIHDLEASRTHGSRFPLIRAAIAGAGLFAAAAGLTFAAAAVISIILGAIGQLLDVIGLGAISDALVKMGEMLSGAGLGALASGLASESNSIGVIAGIWVGVIVYYCWILELFEGWV